MFDRAGFASSAAVASLAVLVSVGQAYAADAVTSVGEPEATATFESIGIVLPFGGDDNQNIRCELEYRPAGASGWERGHDLWVDHRRARRDSRECRGSLVHLRSGTEYEIRLSVTDPDGGAETVETRATTWNEAIPEGEIVEVSDRTSPLEITESGSPNGYRVYRPADGESATIDVGDDHANNIVISANYVIVRGLELTGAQRHAIRIAPEVHDVVVEGTEITHWGPAGLGGVDGWDFWSASGIYVEEKTERIVIQDNQIHHPRGGATSWAEGSEPWQDGSHPAGPQAISFIQTSGNHVIRDNTCYSAGPERFFNDVIGGANNGGTGNLYRDTDVYGNTVSHAYDDGLEIEGYNINVRVWGNVVTRTMKAISTANIGIYEGSRDSSLGPHYIWRNLVMEPVPPNESTTKIRGNGGYYFYHNTVIDAGQAVNAPRQDGDAEVTDVQMVGTVKNNIFLSEPFRTGANARVGASRWYFDANLYRAPQDEVELLGDDWEQNGVFGVEPSFQIEGEHLYYLAPDDPGVDGAERIPNFNDRYAGDGPDIGAFERGAFPRSEACEDGATEACGRGACSGIRRCVDGEWTDCDGGSPSDETCNNGVDDDCDGDADEQDRDCAPPDLTSRRTDSEVAVDGRLEEYGEASPLEFSAETVEEGADPDGVTDSDNEVTVRSRWDERNLYVGVRVADASIEVTSVDRDGEVYSHDGVEVFLDVDRDGGGRLDTRDYHFIVDADGVIWDGRGTGEPDNYGDAGWDSSIVAATGRKEAGYTLEIAIPWSDLEEAPSIDRRFGLLVVNTDLDGGELTYYSQKGAPPWNLPDDWGDLLLVGADDAGMDVGADAGPAMDATGTPETGPASDARAGTETGGAGGASGSRGCRCGAVEQRGPAQLVWFLLLGLLVRSSRKRR